VNGNRSSVSVLILYSSEFVVLNVCSLGELVKHDQNGLVFSTEAELEQQLEVISNTNILEFYCLELTNLIFIIDYSAQLRLNCYILLNCKNLCTIYLK